MNEHATDAGQLSFDLASDPAAIVGHVPDCLPLYTVRVSPRARRLHLKVSPLGKVEVVAPRRVAAQDVQLFVERHREWLRRILARLSAERARYHADEQGVPARIDLRALDQTWTVRHVPGGTRVAVDVCDGSVLHLRGGDQATTVRALRRWLRRYALATLAPRLHEASLATGLPYGSLSVRAQRSRWGSCSSRGGISLNRNLLFLPPALAHYVMIHELCHTRHMNHGARYWRLVQRHAPDYRALEQELRRGDRYIPAWALPE